MTATLEISFTDWFWPSVYGLAATETKQVVKAVTQLSSDPLNDSLRLKPTKGDPRPFDHWANADLRDAGFEEKEIASIRDERPLIAALLPMGPASYGWIISSGPPTGDLVQLVALYNSCVFDYLGRSALSQPSFPQSTFEQLPAHSPNALAEAGLKLVGIGIAPWFLYRALELTYTAWDLEAFANDLGYYGPPMPPSERRG